MEELAKLLEHQTKIFEKLLRQQREPQAVALAPQNVPLPPPFCLEGDMDENFSFFKDNWENYASAIGMDNWPAEENAKKVSFLLSIVGTEALKKFCNFDLTAEDRVSPATVLAAIKRKVTRTRNIIVDRLNFFTAGQTAEESIDDYVARLKSLAKPARLGLLENDMITYKLATSNKWPHLRSKMLTKNNLTEAKAIDLCRVEEITTKHVQTLSVDTLSEVNKIKASSSKARLCKFCGDWHAFTKGSCPAYGKKCKLCSGKNHFEKVCRKNPSRSSNRRRVRRVKKINEDTSDDSDSENEYSEQSVESEIEGEIGKIFDNSKKGGNVLAEVSLKIKDNWTVVKCELDTGANTSLIGHDWLRKLMGESDPELLPSPYKLQAFGGGTINVLGQVRLPCKCQSKKYLLVLQVVDVSHRPLLSLKVCTTFGLIKFCKSVSMVPAQPTSEGDQKVMNIYRIGAEKIIEKFDDVFKGYGKMSGEITLEIDNSVTPVIQQPRRIPIALRPMLKAELDQLQRDGIIMREYHHTEWVSNILLVKRGTKGSESIRICLDPVPLNKPLRRPNLQFVTLEEILPELGQAKVFSTVDARKGFWHVVLDEASSKLTSFWTPFGRYRWLRLPFGISSAPEIFQSKLQEIIQGLNGVECLADDLLIYGRGSTVEEALRDHNVNLEILLARLKQNHVKLNKSKLKLCETSVKFFGHVLSTDGLQPDHSKITSIKHYPVPATRTELHRFIGMVTYLSRFIPNLSANFTKLRRLISEKQPWQWTQVEDEEFAKVKSLVSDIRTLRYYNVHEPLTVECDASCFGLGVAIFQKDGVVGYASRTLTNTERNYAQIEKELLAILFACVRFDQLIVGNPCVTVKTDHKPLINIFNKPLLTAPKRLQHMLLNLQRYQLKLQFVTGKENVVADAISRAPYDESTEHNEYQKLNIYKIFQQLEDCSVMNYLSISDSCLDGIMKATEQDTSLQAVIDYIRNGWPNTIDRVPAGVKIYYKYRSELSTQDGLVFRNDRILIPNALQRSMIDKVHVSHNGIESTLKLARENIFWPGMSAQITDVVKECPVCAKFAPCQQKPPMQSHAIPVYPWQIVSMDVFFASYKGKKHQFLITVDHYSDYIELDILKDMSAKILVETCKRNFSRHGIPQIVNTDNGTNFVNEEMKNMAIRWNFKHSTSSPHHQQSNGKAEAAVKIAKRLIQKANETDQDIWYVLLHWRNIPNKIGSSPVSRLFSRNTRCGVPASFEKYAPRIVPNVPESILESKKKVKYYYDRKTRNLPELETGSPVYVQAHPESNKFWIPATVHEKMNNRSYVVSTNGSCYRRDLVNIKPRNEPATSSLVSIPESSQQDNVNTDSVVTPKMRTQMEPQATAGMDVIDVIEGTTPATPITSKTAMRADALSDAPMRRCGSHIDDRDDIQHYTADDCQVTPVIHVLQYPGCVPKPIPSFACVGRCASYIQVSGSKIWQMERSCMCCQESGEREASVSLFCPKAKVGEKKFKKVHPYVHSLSETVVLSVC
ncbi:retrovirus-related Pol polyprotein from transposon 412 [Sabethes cyaneus]|uniref:retrovirus-related Pol polyprotein from transposon 412 n=1 Tax=Sabethes cyaneus TaxID=53552 RepID=UPI00237E2EB8|nr:retrovirus-related Pol polyprotein from transposon 412 [Sabethes cyaneus]